MKKARVVRWESLEVYCVGRWVLRQRSQYLMCLALLNFAMEEESMALLSLAPATGWSGVHTWQGCYRYGDSYLWR